MIKRVSTAAAFFALTSLVHVDAVSAACAVCFDGAGESRAAFLATTAFLTLLPLGMVGGAGLWLRARARRADEDPEASFTQDD